MANVRRVDPSRRAISNPAEILDRHDTVANPSLDQLLGADRWARAEAARMVAERKTPPRPANGPRSAFRAPGLDS